MSKTRKILSVVLALAMVFATLAVTASAAYYYEDETSATENTQVWTLGTPVDTGDGLTYTVDVSLTTNYPTGTIQFVVENTDNTNVALSGVTVGAAIPATYNAVASYSNTTGKVIIVPQTALNSDSITATAIDGVIATLTYTYSGTGGATINIEEAPKSATTTDGSLIAARISDGDLVTGDLITGQTATFVTNEQTIGSAAEPAIVVVSGYEDSVVIDTNKTFGGNYAGTIYGFEGTSFRAVSYLKTQLAAENGTLTMTKSSVFTGTASCYGTGATVTLNDTSGNPVATYLVIIFGDLDGSGTINPTDVGIIVAHNKGTSTIAAGPVHLAAQLHCSNAGTARSINPNDVSAFVAYNKGTGTIEQSSLAAKHSGFTAAANYGSSYVM